MSDSEHIKAPQSTPTSPGSALIQALDVWDDDVTRPNGYVIIRGASPQQLRPHLRPWLDALAEDGDVLIEISVGSDDHHGHGEDRALALRERLAAAIEARFPDYRDPRAGFHARLPDLLDRLSADYLAPPSRRLLLVVHGLDRLRPTHADDNPLPRLLPHLLPRGVFLLATMENHRVGQRWLNALADLEMIDATGEHQAPAPATMHVPLPPLNLGIKEMQATIDSHGLGRLIADLGEAIARQEHGDRRRTLIDLEAALIALTPQLRGDPEALPALLWGELLDRNWSKRQLLDFFAEQAPVLRRQLPRQHRERASAILEGHSAAVNALALCADGRLLASASSDGTIKLWLVDSGAEQLTLSGHRGSVNACAFTGDGRLLSASDDGDLRLWNTDSGALLQTFRGHEGGIEALALSPDDRLVASLGADGQLVIWELASATEQRRVLAHELGGTALALSDDGKTLATASHDKSVKLWEFPSLAPKATLTGPGYAISGLSFDSKGERIAASSYDNQLWVWALPSGERLREIIGHGSWVTSCQFIDDDLLLSSSRDRSVRLWDLSEGSERCLLRGHTKMVNTAICDPSGTWIFSAGSDRTIRRWRFPSGEIAGEITGEITGESEAHEGPIRACLIGPKAHLYSAGSDGTLRRWHLDSGAARGVYYGHQHAVLGIAISNDGETLLSAGSDRSVKIWNNHNQLVKGELGGHQKWVSACALSPSETQLATACHDATLRIWEMPSGTLQRTLEGHRKDVRCCLFEGSGRLISGGDEGMIRVWDANSGRELMTLAGHEGAVRALSLSADGRHLLSAGADGTIRLWSLRRGRERLVLRGHDAPVVGVAFIDDDHLLSASADRSLRLWSISAERCLSSLRSGHPFGTLSVRLTAEKGGLPLALAGDDAGDLWLLAIDLAAL